MGPDQGYADLLGKTFSALDAKVAKGRNALTRDSARFDDQAAAARDIQAAYAAAAKRLRKAEVRPADAAITNVLVDRLSAVSAAWKRAAAAAADKNKAGFDRSEAAIRRAQRRLAAGVKGLEGAGYELGR